MALSEAQLFATFGDPRPYLREDGSIDGAWETAQLLSCPLPAPLPLVGFPGRMVTRLRVHRRLVPWFAQAFAELHATPEVWATVGDTAGAFCWRLQRKARALSRHGWGIAIDIDVADNPQFTKGKMDPRVIDAFRRAGFEWGGSWRRRPDPMHFEFVDVARLALP